MTNMNKNARTTAEDDASTWYPGDAGPEDIPNPELMTFPSADAAQEGHPHETTSFGGATNYDGGLAPARQKPTKNTSALNAEPSPDVAVYNDGEPSVETVTQESAARTFNAYTLTIPANPAPVYPGDPVRLVGEDPKRQRLFITNGHATDPVMIGSLDQISTGSGFILPFGQRFDPQVQGEIYACIPIPGVNAIQVGIWVERNA